MSLPYKNHAARVETFMTVCTVNRLLFIFFVVYLAAICVNGSISLYTGDRVSGLTLWTVWACGNVCVKISWEQLYAVICEQISASDEFIYTKFISIK